MDQIENEIKLETKIVVSTQVSLHHFFFFSKGNNAS